MLKTNLSAVVRIYSLRIRVALILATLTAFLIAFMAISDPADAKKKGKFKTITQLFSSTQTITIPRDGALTNGADINADPYPSTINVSGFKKAKILDVKVKLNGFTHTFPDDVDVLLAHSGQNATILSDVGGGASISGVNLTLDDQATTSLPDGGPHISGTFKPTDIEVPDVPPDNDGLDNFPSPAPTDGGSNDFSAFKGANPNGDWQLFIVDDLGDEDQGQFAGGWALEITAKAKEKKHKHQ